MKKLTLEKFSSLKREKLLEYSVYENSFDEMIVGFDIVRKTQMLLQYQDKPENVHKLAIPYQQRAYDSLIFLINCFSGGHSISDLAALYPSILQYWSFYTDAWKKTQELDSDEKTAVAAIPLLDTAFSRANQIVCLSILLGRSGLLRQAADVVDFNNPVRDGMLERLLSAFMPDRAPAPDECTRHLPYFKTLKIFSSPNENRSSLMKEYLEDWYEASRREVYYNSHKRGDAFTGYWSWEAAAITYILDIDDGSFRDAMFYPVDLVDYARGINAPKSYKDLADNVELREKSGRPCPKAGRWETLDIPPQQREFKYGEILQASHAAYGITIWRYLDAP